MAKDAFDLLDADEKTAIENSTDDELNKRIGDVAKNDAALAEALAEDKDVATKKEALKDAKYQYTQGKKANKQRIAYARSILQARGKDAGTASISPQA